MIRIVLADDHTLVREGIRTLLGLVEDIELVGEASNGAAALRRLSVFAGRFDDEAAAAMVTEASADPTHALRREA